MQANPSYVGIRMYKVACVIKSFEQLRVLARPAQIVHQPVLNSQNCAGVRPGCEASSAETARQRDLPDGVATVVYVVFRSDHPVPNLSQGFEA